jgi:hypothetical protein
MGAPGEAQRHSVEPDGLDREEVARQNSGGLGAEELGPRLDRSASKQPQLWRGRMLRTKVADTLIPSLAHSPTDP